MSTEIELVDCQSVHCYQPVVHFHEFVTYVVIFIGIASSSSPPCSTIIDALSGALLV